jgi:hypothetical protein
MESMKTKLQLQSHKSVNIERRGSKMTPELLTPALSRSVSMSSSKGSKASKFLLANRKVRKLEPRLARFASESSNASTESPNSLLSEKTLPWIKEEVPKV